MTIEDIIHFWFIECSPQNWWQKDVDFDAEIRRRFFSTHQKAIQNALFSWRESSEGRLAEIIVLDQFSRNLFRDSANAFSYDAMALTLAQEAVSRGVDKMLPIEKRAFLYMPYMHSESKCIHKEAEKLFKQEGMEHNYEFELQHKAIIDKFGRYPHRNIILNRHSTPEEIAFLKEPNSSF